MFKVNKANGFVLVSLLLTSTYFTPCSVSVVNFEHVIASWAKVQVTVQSL